MKLNIKNKKVNKLIKQIEYLKSDLDYKSEVFVEVESEFYKAVDDYLNTNEQLKNRYKECEKIRYEQNLKNIDKDIEQKLDKDIDQVEPPISDPKIKKIFREIVKKTHPDKNINNENLEKYSEYYNDAMGFYENNDIIELSLIANEIGIDIDCDDIDISLIEESVIDYKSQIGLVESTFPWKWESENNEEIKLKFIKAFVIQNLK